MLLIRDSETSVEFWGKRFDFDLSFDRVLAVYEIIETEELDETELVEVALKILVKNSVDNLPLSLKKVLLNHIFIKHINGEEKRSGGKPSMSYTKDAAYIYASFMQAYGMDLTKERGRLSWSKFKALVEGLPAGSKLREVIEIRSRKIPKRTKHNSEEIKNLIALKRHYALKTKINNNYQEGATALFNILKAQAESR